MLSEKLSVILDDFKELLPLGLIDWQGASFHEIKIFFGGIRVCVGGLSAIPWTFEVVSLDNFFVGVKDIGHDDKVYSTNNFPFLVFL